MKSFIPHEMTDTGSEFENWDDSSASDSDTKAKHFFAEFDESKWSSIPTQDLSFVRFDSNNVKAGTLSLWIPGTWLSSLIPDRNYKVTADITSFEATSKDLIQLVS